VIRLDLPTVRRIRTETGSHIEPELDPAWDEATKLAWHAAVTAHDTGLAIKLHDEALIRHGKNVSGYYAINVGRHSCSAFTYQDAWSYLNGVSVGANGMRDQSEEPPCPTT
jgi:hypothetical protein